MKIHKLLILLAAALGGYAVYKARIAPTEPGTSYIPGEDFYSNVNGSGSIGETYRAANDGRSSGAANTNRAHSGSAKIGQSNAVEDFAESDAALIEASAKGDTKKVESRLANRARVDSRDVLRRTPLMYASWNNHPDICERLLAAGANPELKDRNGSNAYDYAAGRGLTELVDLLLKRKHSKDDGHYGEYAKLIQAAFAGDAALLPPGKGKLVSINRINPEGQAPLHIAAGNGSIPLMQELVARGAEVNLPNNNRQTPLLWAAWNNQAEAVKLLLERGADSAKPDLGGNTALMMAVQNKSVAAAKILIEHGADKYAANKQGKTAAIIAEDNGLKELLYLLK